LVCDPQAATGNAVASAVVAAPNLNRPGGAFPDGAALTAITSLLHTGYLAYLDAYLIPSEPETTVKSS
jgi:hypothetical protein